MSNEQSNEQITSETKGTAKHKRIKAGDKEGSFIIQSGNNEYDVKKIKEMCVNAYKGDTRKRVKTIDVYVKFENGSIRAYYVVNGKSDGLYIEL